MFTIPKRAIYAIVFILVILALIYFFRPTIEPFAKKVKPKPKAAASGGSAKAAKRPAAKKTNGGSNNKKPKRK